jgi:hypothetical protein
METPLWRANGRAPGFSGLSDNHVLMIGVGNLSDGGTTIEPNNTNLSGGKAELRGRSFLRDQLRHAAGATNQLSAGPGFNSIL